MNQFKRKARIERTFGQWVLFVEGARGGEFMPSKDYAIEECKRRKLEYTIIK